MAGGSLSAAREALERPSAAGKIAAGTRQSALDSICSVPVPYESARDAADVAGQVRARAEEMGSPPLVARQTSSPRPAGAVAHEQEPWRR